MAVLLETSRGDLVIDLFTKECPLASTNFLKLCKLKYYNNCLVHNIVPGFIAQTGDPTGSGRGGDSVYRLLYGDQARFFDDEVRKTLKHHKPGTVGMAGAGKDMNASQFYFTLGSDLDSLDGKHTVFGEVSEGIDVLTSIGAAFVDDSGRPLQNIRIRHTHILDDPFPDPPALEGHMPEASPEPEFEQGDRLEDDWQPEQDERGAEERADESRKLEAHSRAVVLEMIGDLPEADAKPPSDMLFVCKLNPVTTEEDLEIIFSRFGKITSCDILRDYKTGDSLCYAFIGFDSDKGAEDAFFKMNNVLIDDRRIKVDFSQSVHHLWKQFRRFGRAGNQPGTEVPKGDDKPAAGSNGRPQLQLKPGAGGYGAPGSSNRSLIMEDDLPSTSAPGSRHADRGGTEGHHRDRHQRDVHRGDDRGSEDRRRNRTDDRAHGRGREGDQEDRQHADARNGRYDKPARESQGMRGHRGQDAQHRHSMGDERDRKHKHRHDDDRDRAHGRDHKHRRH